jgi:hypothetical protein
MCTWVISQHVQGSQAYSELSNWVRHLLGALSCINAPIAELSSQNDPVKTHFATRVALTVFTAVRLFSVLKAMSGVV